MPRAVPFLLAVFLVSALVGCGKSGKNPAAPPELPDDPNASAPALAFVNHFSPDTQWVEITPTADDVEVRDIEVSLQYASGGGWMPMAERLVGGPVIARSATAVIEVTNPWKGHAVYDVTLWLSIRRTAYRTWFRVQVE